MYLKHLNQTNRTMNVTIEHVFCRYSDEAEEIYFRIMNTILFATDETELRASMERLKNETSLDEYFIFGYGAHHIWINQRRPSDKNRIFKNRIMVAHFPFLFCHDFCFSSEFVQLLSAPLLQALM